jgi:predicted transposase YdaD
MQETIRRIMENMIHKSGQEVDMTVTANIIETLPWIDYSEVFEKIEERGKAEGKAEGFAEAQMKIALNAFERVKHGGNRDRIVETLKDLGIPDEVIRAAHKQTETR